VNYVLDTNIVSSLMRGDVFVAARLRAVTRSAVVVPQPVFAEIASGVERLPKSKKKTSLTAQFALLRRELATCPWTDEVTDAFGQIKAMLERRGQRIEDFDAAIAAHAVAHDATLVTANTFHMSRIAALALEDWSQAPTA
jgi:tRNA(fMet)-specific endonuclease VapC